MNTDLAASSSSFTKALAGIILKFTDGRVDLTSELTWLFPIAIFFLVLIIGQIILHYGSKQLSQLVRRSASRWDDELVAALYRPFLWMVFIGALAAAAQAVPEAISLKPVHWSLFKLLLVVWFNWVLWITASTLIRSDLAQSWSDEARSLVLLVLRIVVIVLTVLGIADGLGLSITPVLASLGVGSLAVALALQDTLSNFFAGIYLLIDKPVRIGDFVKIDEATEGHVFRIGWRSTWLRLPSNNIVVIPNNKLLSSQVTNFNLDDSKCYVSITLGVAYESDLERVEQLLITTTSAVLREHDALDTEEPPLVRFQQFGDSSIDLKIIIKLANIVDQPKVRHFLIKKIHDVFRREGIDIPFPQRTVHMISNVPKLS